eukprot:TRINITY_DN11738_c0_g1_i1.p1 TRINITY_DN11738_c0_g1~~TRINITY_DN11738_c0_g1_i1.p1  ORF type:complete len:279 (-),score=81.25 TRINITY_DN11738_c0_g1_i1:178-1014(-)
MMWLLFLFEELRNLRGISTSQFLQSLTATKMERKKSAGKSNSFFFTSHDKKFVMKSLNNEEAFFLATKLYLYHQHLTTQKNSLLNWFYGLFAIQGRANQIIFFVAMENLFPLDLKIKEIYDLKGSSVGRSGGGGGNELVILKDLDLKRKIQLGDEKKKLLLEQIEIDCEWLESQHIMDYSLLFIVCDRDKGKEGNLNTENTSMFKCVNGGFLATNEKNFPLDEVYYMGIIDMLQEYNWRKKLETNFKTILTGSGDAISCVEPAKYSQRFQAFIKSSIS